VGVGLLLLGSATRYVAALALAEIKGLVESVESNLNESDNVEMRQFLKIDAAIFNLRIGFRDFFDLMSKSHIDLCGSYLLPLKKTLNIGSL
jgi:hypothetical protein